MKGLLAPVSHLGPTLSLQDLSLFIIVQCLYPHHPLSLCPHLLTDAELVSLVHYLKRIKTLTQTLLGRTLMIYSTKLALNQTWLVTRRYRSGGYTCYLIDSLLFLQAIPTVKGPLPLPTSISSSSSMPTPFLMPSNINPFMQSGVQQCTVTLPPLYHKSGTSSYFGLNAFDTLSQPLDSLDSLSISDYKSGERIVIKMAVVINV